jgi:hypothetical protein
MENMDTLHPIRILAQPDADITTVLHSFFVLAYDPVKSSIDVLARHPLSRKNIDQAEDGLKQFLVDPQVLGSNEEMCVSHVMTNHDGRLFLFARCFKHKIIGFVSALPIISFLRSLLRQLEVSPVENILPIIYTFCEFPILPLPSVHYNFQFADTSVVISFGGLQNVEEPDMDIIAMTVLTPFMMVKAWEAIILDRSVLVVSKDTSLLLPCCEFLRKLISPMSFSGTFIPIMPSIELLEACGTFLMGADLNVLTATDAPLSGVVILDLDRRLIIHTPIVYGQGLPEEPYLAAPPALLQTMLKKITLKQQDPLAKWMQRGCAQSYGIEEFRSNASCSKRCTDVLKYFSFINTALLSAQCCTIGGFYRTIKPDISFIHHVLSMSASSHHDDLSKLGYSEDCGFIVGYMQFWKDTEAEEPIHRTIFCWSELDNSTLAVYEFADDLPLLLIPIEEIGAVASCSMEPEGHVFEITLKSQQVFRFTSNDQPSRQAWLNAIEQKLTNTSKNLPSPAIANIQQIRTTNFAEYYTLGAASTPTATNAANGAVETFSIKSLGHPAGLREIDPTIALHYQEFRNLVRKTQNCLFLNTETQSAKFETLFTKRRETLMSFLSPKHFYEVKMRKYISNIHRIGDMLLQIKKDVDNGRVDDEPSNIDPAIEPLSPVVHAKLQRTTTETGQDSITATSSEQDPKRGFITRLFSSSKKKPLRDSLNNASSNAIAATTSDDKSSHHQTSADLEREAHEKFMFLTMHKLLHVVLAYNRALSEINNYVVDDRFKYLNQIINEAKQKVLYLTFNMQELISSESLLGNEFIQKYHRDRLSVKSPFKKQYPQFTTTGEENLFEILCEVLVPPAVAFKNPGVSRTTSYVGTSVANGGTSENASDKLFPGESMYDLTNNDGYNSGTRSPNPHKVSFAQNPNEPRDEDAFLAATRSSTTMTFSNSLFENVVDLAKSEAGTRPSAALLMNSHQNTDSPAIPAYTDDLGDIKIVTESFGDDVNLVEGEFDMKEFYDNNLENEYETMINGLHNEIKKHVLQFLFTEETKRIEQKNSLFVPVISTLIGYLLNDIEDYHMALIYYSKSNLINQSRISQCLLKWFVKKTHASDFYELFNEPRFIVDGYSLKPTIGMHSYRLVLELVHNELKAAAEKREHTPISDPSIALTSFRSFFRSGTHPGKKLNKAAS